MSDLELLPKAAPELLEEGVRRIEWARDHMGVLGAIRERFEAEKPLAGLRVGMALHVEAKTGNLALALQAGGAEVRLAGCNPDSTDDRVALALDAHYGLPTRAKKGQNKDEYYASLDWVLDAKPHLVIDDGGDLGFLAHTRRTDVLDGIRGGAEETTTGVIRFKAMADEGKLRFPVLNVNDAKMKHLFDNRYGTGQSTFDGLMHATNLVIAGKTIVVAGYGWCGRGITMRGRGMGADIIVTEVDPVRAIEARMDGNRVMAMEDAVREADMVVTATGCSGIIDARHIPHLKDGVVLANAGHFDNEIDKPALQAAAASVETVREGVTRYRLKDGRRVDLVADGRLVNLASGQGHPVEIMDTSFAVQALGIEYMAAQHDALSPGVHDIPAEIDEAIARIKLDTLGIRIDELTQEQTEYLTAWEHGT